MEVSVEELTRFILLSLYFLTSVEVNIVLPAVPGLVLVGEPGIEGNSLFEEALFSDNSGHFESDKKTDLKHRSQVLI